MHDPQMVERHPDRPVPAAVLETRRTGDEDATRRGWRVTRLHQVIVVRDLFLGRTRFKDFVASPEGIPTNVLSERLERLLEHGIVEQVPAVEGSKRLGYRLTAKGKALRPMLHAMRDWGLAWGKGTEARLEATKRRPSSQA